MLPGMSKLIRLREGVLAADPGILSSPCFEKGLVSFFCHDRPFSSPTSIFRSMKEGVPGRV